MKNITVRQSILRYSIFDKTKMTDVLFEQIDFTEASLTEARLKNFEAVNCKFLKNDFFKTILAGIDFSDSEFSAPMVSNPPVELKGAIINMFQAADLIGLWGVIVKQ